MRKFLTFSIFHNVFSGIILALIWGIMLSNPQNITSTNDLIWGIFILVWIIAIAGSLDVYYFSMAVSFKICNENIEFEYYNKKIKTIAIEDIVEVICKPQRYTFKTRDGKKIYLGRQKGLLKVETKVNPQIQKTFSEKITA